MKNTDSHIDPLLAEIATLKEQLQEANSIIDAIREGAVDALVLNKNGQPQIYSMESADYTYRVLIEKFGEGALNLSPDGLILYCNDAFSKMINRPSSTITGTYFNTYVDSPETFEMLKSRLANGRSKGEMILNAEESKITVYISLTDLHPTVEAIGVVVTDLTEKRKHEDALLQSQKRLEMKVNELHLTNTNLEQFIHVISHDIKEPLRKILTYTSHLSETAATLLGESQLKNVNVINSSALRLNSLVDDLVKYAFSATKDETIKVSLDQVVREVVDDLEIVITEKSARVVFADLPKVNASRVQMRQLFANLISNAIKYSKTDATPVVTILASIIKSDESLSDAAQFYKVSIQDNGIGMDQAHVNKIFTIFQRLHLRNEYSGNGIGLAICKKIMENHHGKIEVETQLGEGSIFHLYFPVIE